MRNDQDWFLHVFLSFVLVHQGDTIVLFRCVPHEWIMQNDNLQKSKKLRRYITFSSGKERCIIYSLIIIFSLQTLSQKPTTQGQNSKLRVYLYIRIDVTYMMHLFHYTKLTRREQIYNLIELLVASQDRTHIYVNTKRIEWPFYIQWNYSSSNSKLEATFVDLW